MGVEDPTAACLDRPWMPAVTSSASASNLASDRRWLPDMNRGIDMFFKCVTHAPADDRGQAPVVTGGQKHLTVDIHCHVHVPAADALLPPLSATDDSKAPATVELTAEINRTQQQTILPKLTDPAIRLTDMDACGIDVQALSPSPAHYNYGYPAEIVRETSRIVNDRIAEIVAGNPDRFVGLCTVPLQDVDMAVAELDRCVKEHGARGVEISTNVNGQDLTRAGLEKFFARVEQLDVMIFMHPIGTSFTERMSDHYFTNTIGHPLESALAVGHLVFDGYLEEFPGLKICIAHGGGYVPTYSGRFDHPYHLRDDCRQIISKPPSEYVKRLYFDTVVFTDHQLRYLVETWGANHIVMGTDYPYDMAEPDPVGFVDSTSGLSEDQKSTIMGGNAARLLKLDVVASA
ncbi:MAG: amidohydrolase [Acidimicrobiia bacterium]|nr:amidohydrolase [Acidimicrobiia bacterium]